MAEVKDPTEGWQPYLQSLPPVYAGFALDCESCETGLLYRIFSYRNVENQRSVSIVYDRSTVEFMAGAVGLVEFCDVRFIHLERDRFEAILQTSLLPLLDSLQCCIPDRMETLFRNKKLYSSGIMKVFLLIQLHGFS